MALLSEEMDSDLLRLWGLVAELSEQLNANRSMTAALQAQAAQAKGQVIHSGTGFVLRRFNTDLSQEVFESELERMNASLVIENQTLLHENKQLGSLLKEYEQTLETVMAKFRSQAHASQQHELTLTRHYETLLLSRESNMLNQDLVLSSAQSESLARLAHLVRMSLRSLAGEDPEADDQQQQAFASSSAHHSPRTSPPPHSQSQLEQREGYREGGYSGSPPPLEDWALEREIEITRLEKENEELRRLLAISNGEEVPGTSSLGSGSMSFGSDGGLWEGSTGGGGYQRPQGAFPRRGLLAQNRMRMANGGMAQRMNGMGVGGGPGGGNVMGGGGQGAGGIVGGQQQQQFLGGGPQAPSPWGTPDPTQKKVGSYFKEFPT